MKMKKESYNKSFEILKNNQNQNEFDFKDYLL
jgi:hypothetical protein